MINPSIIIYSQCGFLKQLVLALKVFQLLYISCIKMYIELNVTRIYYKSFMKEVGEIELFKHRSLKFFHYEGSENS